jgi:SAM-dependent methyltransferase
MPDVWATVSQLDAATQQRLAEVLETRGADPQQQAMRRAFLAEIAFPTQARVLEVGCGTGVLTRVLARWPEVAEVVGVDVAPSLLVRARELAAGLPNLSQSRQQIGHLLRSLRFKRCGTPVRQPGDSSGTQRQRRPSKGPQRSRQSVTPPSMTRRLLALRPRAQAGH